MVQVNKQNPKSPTRISSANDNILDQIGPMEFDDTEGIKMLLYGRQGTGKTTLWSTFPKPILVILCSGGARPSELRSVNTPEMKKVIDQVKLVGPPWRPNDLRIVAQAVAKKQKVHSLTKKPYATVVLDHATGFQDLILANLLNLEEIPTQKTWGMTNQQGWGTIGVQTKDHLRYLLDVPQNCVIVAHERTFGKTEENEESEHTVIMPSVGAALTPTAAGFLHGTAEYVGQMFIRQVKNEVKEKGPGGTTATRIKRDIEYCLRIKPDGMYAARFRTPREKARTLPDIIVDPTYEKIAQYLR